MASNSKKVISINPEFFKISGKKKKDKKEKKKKRRDNDILSSSVNKGLKKSLLNKLKEHQRKKAKEKEKNSQISSLDENVDDELEKSIDYLNDIVKKRKDKKEKRKNKAKTLKKRHGHENINSTISPQIKVETSVVNKENISLKQPKFGCLKGGKLPTLRQYNKTLKNRDEPKNDNRPPVAFNDTPVYNETFDERQKNFSKIKVNYNNVQNKVPTATILPSVPIVTPPPIPIIQPVIPPPIPPETDENIKKKKKKKKKHKLKTVKRKITLGKKHGMVGVLIKNRKTRKNIKKEVANLEKKSMTNIKRYLRKHNLIKIGTPAPDDILRNIYEDSFLSGDIYNKNPDTLLHNFMKA